MPRDVEPATAEFATVQADFDQDMLACAGLALAQNWPWLVVWHALFGLAGGATFLLGLVMAADVVPAEGASGTLGAFDAAVDLLMVVSPAIAVAVHARLGQVSPLLLGAGLLWFGVRQRRRLPRWSGMGLQILAAFAFVARGFDRAADGGVGEEGGGEASGPLCGTEHLDLVAGTPPTQAPLLRNPYQRRFGQKGGAGMKRAGRLHKKATYGPLCQQTLEARLRRELMTNFGFEQMGVIADVLIQRFLAIIEEYAAAFRKVAEHADELG